MLPWKECCLTLTQHQISHLRCLSWYRVIYTLLWVEKSPWRSRQSPHKSKLWTIEADEKYKIACIKPSKLLASVRHFTENTPQQEMIRSNEWTRNMFELTNTLWQTLWGFFCFIFIVFHFLSAYKCLTDRHGGWHYHFKTDREWTSTFLNTDPKRTTFPKNKSNSLTPVATPCPTLLFLPRDASAKMKLCWRVLLSSGYTQLMIRNWMEVLLPYIHLPKFSKASPGSIGCHALMTIYYWRKLSTFSLQPITPEFCRNTKKKEIEICGNNPREQGGSFLLFTVSSDRNQEGTR